MSNEFGTVSVRRDRGREIELLRIHYVKHRETLSALANEAPSEHLASEYQRLLREIDSALGKLGELEGRVPADTNPAMRPEVPRTEPGSRQLRTPPSVMASEEPAAPNALPRIALIVLAGIVVLAIIGWLMWRASGERPIANSRPMQTKTAAAAAGPVTPAPKPLPVAGIAVDPPAQDYGAIRRGTRAVRQFVVTNNSDRAMTLNVARSKCRCLYYEYPKSVAPHARETVTVTVDGAKAKAGALREVIGVSSKGDPTAGATVQVTAVVR